MADLVSYGTGINVFDIAFAQALGDTVPDSLVTRRFTRPVAIRFLTASPGVLPVGTVTSISGLDSVRGSPGILAADLYVGEGATLRPVQVDADRSGYVIATAATSLAALERADRAAEQLVVRVGESEPSPLRRQRRRRLVGSAALAAAILGAFSLAIALTSGGRLRDALIRNTRVSRQLSPRCRCPNDVARINFRLLRREPVTFRIVNASGRTVATLARDRLLAAGKELFDWRGRNANGRVLPNGDYTPEVTFDSLHRTVVLHGPIDLDG